MSIHVHQILVLGCGGLMSHVVCLLDGSTPVVLCLVISPDANKVMFLLAILAFIIVLQELIVILHGWLRRHCLTNNINGLFLNHARRLLLLIHQREALHDSRLKGDLLRRHRQLLRCMLWQARDAGGVH